MNYFNLETEINKKHLDFLNEARQAFEKNSNYHTYRDKDDCFIALRTGVERDCIEIYELNGKVALFSQVIDVSKQ